MDPNALAGMVFTLALAALIGGLILLYPVSKRLGLLLEAKVREQKSRERTEPAAPGVDAAVRALRSDVASLAERQAFVEQLLARREPDRLPAPRAGEAQRPDID